MNPQKTDPFRKIWLKCEEKLGDDSALHKEVLAFASDFNLMSTALIPHRKFFKPEEMQMASVDHSMWFHRDFRADEGSFFRWKAQQLQMGEGLAGVVFSMKREKTSDYPN